MSRLQNWMENQAKRLSDVERAAFLSTFLIGIISHIYALTNNFIYADGTQVDGLGATYSSGRWMLGELEQLLEWTIGIWQTPVFNGVCVCCFIAMSGILIVRLFDIKNKITACLIGVIMVVFPVVASTFAYMYTAAAYFFALLLSVWGIFYIIRSKKRFLLGTLFIAAAMGIYQAYFSVSVAIALMYLIIGLFFSKEPFSGMILKGLKYLAGLILSLGEYLCFNKIFCILKHIELNSYQGIADMGKDSAKSILIRIPQAYADFFIPSAWGGINGTAFMCRLVICVMALIVAMVILCVIFGESSFCCRMLGCVLCILLPLAFDLVFLMSASENYFVHTLMRYTLVFLFVFLLILAERVEGLTIFAEKVSWNLLISSLSVIIISGISIGYIYANNAAYQRMTILQKQAESYFTVLVSEIKDMEGYQDEMPVAYVGERKIEDASLGNLSSDIGNVTGFAYTIPGMLNNWGWKRELFLYTGFQPNETGQDFLEANKELVDEMPCYPDDGGIRIIDGTVVVKFAEME